MHSPTAKKRAGNIAWLAAIFCVSLAIAVLLAPAQALTPAYAAQPAASTSAAAAAPGAASFSVTYDANGGHGTVPVDDKLYAAGSVVTVRFDVTPVRAGFSFLGWATDSQATTPGYTKTYDTLRISRSLTLYAVWQESDADNGAATTAGAASAGSSANPGAVDLDGSGPDDASLYSALPTENTPMRTEQSPSASSSASSGASATITQATGLPAGLIDLIFALAIAVVVVLTVALLRFLRRFRRIARIR